MEELRRLLGLVEWKKGFHSADAANAFLDSFVYLSGERIAVSLAGLELRNKGLVEWAELAQQKQLHLRYLIFSSPTPTPLTPAANKSTLSFSLAGLDIGRNRVTATGLQALLANVVEPLGSRLTHLLVDSNRIGDEGAAALAHALLTNVSLRSLSAYNNNIGDVGAEALAVSLAVRVIIYYKCLGIIDVQGDCCLGEPHFTLPEPQPEPVDEGRV